MSEQGVQKGTYHASLRSPVLRISVVDVLLPTLTTWGQLHLKKLELDIFPDLLTVMS
jgi:hypothetical protein